MSGLLNLKVTPFSKVLSKLTAVLLLTHATSVLSPSKGKETIQEVRQPEEGENKEREGEKGKKGEGTKREESQAVRGEVQSQVGAQ